MLEVIAIRFGLACSLLSSPFLYSFSLARLPVIFSLISCRSRDLRVFLRRIICSDYSGRYSFNLGFSTLSTSSISIHQFEFVITLNIDIFLIRLEVEIRFFSKHGTGPRRYWAIHDPLHINRTTSCSCSISTSLPFCSAMNHLA
ncbi:hypothetical protein YC2023_076237 [Brassica napus]